MTASFQVNAPNTIVIFSYVAPTTKTQQVVTDCAHYIWEQGNRAVAFETLTNQQKLNLVDGYLRTAILELAKTYAVQTAAEAARLAAIIGDGSSHELN